MLAQIDLPHKVGPVHITDCDIEVPSCEELTIPGLRVSSRQEVLLQIASALKQHVSTQRSIVSNILWESKARPTFVEISRMFTAGEAPISEYVHVEAVSRISQQFSGQVHSSLSSAQSEVANMRTELSRINDKFLEGFRRLDQQMAQCEVKSKQAVTHTRAIGRKIWLQWRQRKLFSAWKDSTAASTRKKQLLLRFVRRGVSKQKSDSLSQWRALVNST
jgi:hypothetical protein